MLNLKEKIKDKNNWHIFLTVLILIVSIYSVVISNSNYKIEVKREKLQNEPFFNFYFSDEYNYKGFIAKSEENINIRRVEWFIPDVSGKAIMEISKHPNLLTIDDIINTLAFDMFHLYSRSIQDFKDIIRCHLFAAINEFGIPLGVKIEYEKQGNIESYFTKDILVAKKLDTSFPFIEHRKRNVSKEEFENFFREQRDFLNNVFEEFKDSKNPTNDAGECRIFIDQPGMGF